MKNLKWTAWLMSALMCGAAVAGISAGPNIPEEPNFLEATVPTEFGGWRKLEERAQIIDPATKKKAEELTGMAKEHGSKTAMKSKTDMGKSRSQQSPKKPVDDTTKKTTDKSQSKWKMF